MYELGIGGYRPVRAPQSAEITAGTETKKASAAGTQTARDVASLSGRGQAAQTMSAEQALGKLHALGVLESASRPLPVDPETLGDPAAELTVRLNDGEAAQAETEAGAPQDAAEEWRPYQPPAGAAQSPQLVSEDGSVKLTLFPTADGAGEVMLELDGILLPLNDEGALLAGLLDGSFRMLTLNPEALLQLLEAGLASIALPDGAATDAPPRTDLPELPQQPRTDASRTDAPQTAQSAAPEAAGQRASAPPVPARRLDALRAALNTGTEPAKTMKFPEPPPEKPGGAMAWAAARGPEQSFHRVTENWLRETAEPWKPEAMAQLQTMRQDWAANLKTTDSATFRAWESLPVSGGEEAPLPAEAEPTEEAVAPRADAAQFPARDVPTAAPQAAKPTEDSAAAFLRTVLTAARPAEGNAATEESVALLKSALLAGDDAWRKQDDDGSLTRRLSDYLAQLRSGDARANTRDHAEEMDLPQYPQRGEDELDRAWLRRKIAFEVDSAWTGNLKTWLLHVDGWRISRSQDYVNAQANEWTTGLMNDQPAQFRQWLGSPLRYAASTGWFNGATGSFPINTLPEGFTDEDFRRWMQWDVLDYL